MLVTLTIINYPKRFTFFGLVAMGMHRLPLWFNKNISFYKLLGSGKNGTFDIHPDWQQWGIFAIHENTVNMNDIPQDNHITVLHGLLIGKWLRLFKCETWTIFLEPLEGHGSWDRREPFGQLPKNVAHDGMIAILTRASIRISKLKTFWQNVGGVAGRMDGAAGFITSIGIGELPLIKQATFSVWENKEAMRQFAYQSQQHVEVIRKTRSDNWYREDMFVRFKPLKAIGTIKGTDPLAGKF